MDLQTVLAAQGYARNSKATAPAPGAQSGMADFANKFAETLNKGESTAKAAMMGQADQLSLVNALAQTEIAVDAAVAVRNRVVEAYQEILRMPV